VVDAKVPSTENAAWFLLKVFLAFGGLFGIMIGATDYFFNHNGGNWVLGGLFFGTFMTLILGVIYLIRGRRLGWTRAARVNQRGTAVVSGPMDHAMAQVRAVLARVSAREIRVIDGETPTLLAKMPFSLWSFGEKIRIEFHDAHDGTVKIEVGSRPLLFTTMVDYGKNLDNVDSILSGLGTEEKRVQGAS